ncbi:MAG: divergent PAP2 family protein [Armatimonadota bacterium]
MAAGEASVNNIWNNKILIVAIIADLIAQGIKPLIHYGEFHEWRWGLLFSNGGFPSSHSATVTALTAMVGFTEGFASPLFAICMVFSGVVVFDASGVRQEVGRHAKTLNAIFEEFKLWDRFDYKHFTELVGHTVFEVIGGMALGLLVALLSLRIPFLKAR